MIMFIPMNDAKHCASVEAPKKLSSIRIRDCRWESTHVANSSREHDTPGDGDAIKRRTSQGSHSESSSVLT